MPKITWKQTHQSSFTVNEGWRMKCGDDTETEIMWILVVSTPHQCTSGLIWTIWGTKSVVYTERKGQNSTFPHKHRSMDNTTTGFLWPPRCPLSLSLPLQRTHTHMHKIFFKKFTLNHLESNAGPFIKKAHAVSWFQMFYVSLYERKTREQLSYH